MPKTVTGAGPAVKSALRYGRCAAWWHQRLRGRSNAFVAIGVAIAIASYINTKTNSAWPSREAIAADLGLSVKSVDRGIELLIAVGILRRTLRWHESSVYEICLDESTAFVDPRPVRDSTLLVHSNNVMTGQEPTDESTTPREQESTTDVAQTYEDNEVGTNDDARARDTESDRRARVAAKLKALGAWDNQLDELTTRERLDVAEVWGDAGIPEGKRFGWIVTAIREGRRPEKKPKTTASRYPDFTGFAASGMSAAEWQPRGELRETSA